MSSAAYVSPYRTEDQRFDAAIEDMELRGAGVIEDDQPTVYSHDVWMRRYYERAQGEFTPHERELIRAYLALGPFGESDA